MQKVEVLPELYLGGQDMYYVVAVTGRVYCNTHNRLKPFISSAHTITSLSKRNYPVAPIKMRFIYVYY